jgi:hypothetical protein
LHIITLNNKITCVHTELENYFLLPPPHTPTTSEHWGARGISESAL